MNTNVTEAAGDESVAASGDADDQATLDKLLASLAEELERGWSLRQSLLAALGTK